MKFNKDYEREISFYRFLSSFTMCIKSDQIKSNSINSEESEGTRLAYNIKMLSR